jgi:hypothetical protein
LTLMQVEIDDGKRSANVYDSAIYLPRPSHSARTSVTWTTVE